MAGMRTHAPRGLRLLINSLFLAAVALAGMLKVAPTSGHWLYPLHPYGHMHHHCIMSILYDAAAHPGFLQGDLVVTAVTAKYPVPVGRVIAWCATAKVASLPTIITILFVTGVTLNCAGIAYLSFSLFRSRLAAALTALVFIWSPCELFLADASANHPRAISQGLCLFSLALFFRRRFIGSALLCGGATFFHYGMPVYLAAACLVYFAAEIRRIRLRDIAAWAILILCSIPFGAALLKDLLFSTAPPYDSAAAAHILRETGWFWSSLRLAPYKLLAFHAPYLGLLVLLAARRHRLTRAYGLISLGLVGCESFHFLVFDCCFVAPLARAVFFNAHYFFPVLGAALLPGLALGFTAGARTKRLLPVHGLVLFACLWLLHWHHHTLSMCRRHDAINNGIFALYALTLWWGAQRKAPWAYGIHVGWRSLETGARRLATGTTYMAASAVMALWALGIPSWNLGADGTKTVEEDGWFQAQRWAREHTAPDALFILPDTWGHFGWRIYAKRSTLCSTMYEAHLIVLLAPELTDAVVRQLTSFWQSTEASAQRYKERFSELPDLLAMHAAERAHLRVDGYRKIKAMFPSVTYVVTARDAPIALPLAYGNERYHIYRIDDPNK